MKKEKTNTSEKEVAIVKKKINTLQQMVVNTVVTNDDELASVSDKIKQTKILSKYIKTLKDAFVVPAKEIVERAKELYDHPLKECSNAEIVLKQKAQVYLTDKENARLKAEKKIADDLAKGKIKKDETAIKKLEKLPEQKKKVQTENSGLRMQKRMVAEIVDRELIPKEFWVIDEVGVRKEALRREKNGVEQIPGVKVIEKSTMMSV